jgi:hypothetical protein
MQDDWLSVLFTYAVCVNGMDEHGSSLFLCPLLLAWVWPVRRSRPPRVHLVFTFFANPKQNPCRPLADGAFHLCGIMVAGAQNALKIAADAKREAQEDVDRAEAEKKLNYQAAEAAASASAANAAASSGGMTLIIIVVVVVLVLIIVVAFVVTRTNGGDGVKSPVSFENPMYATATSGGDGGGQSFRQEESAYADPNQNNFNGGGGGYMDVNVNQQATGGYMDVNANQQQETEGGYMDVGGAGGGGYMDVNPNPGGGGGYMDVNPNPGGQFDDDEEDV